MSTNVVNPFAVPPLKLLVNGHAAVIIFFILSGLVLSLQIISRPSTTYIQFLSRRFCRLYLPFSVVILCSYILHFAISPLTVTSLSNFYDSQIWQQDITPDQLFGHFLMTGLQSDMWLDIVMWTLVHEMRIALIFPFLFLLVRRCPTCTLIGGFAIWSLTDVVLTGLRWDGSIGASLLATAHYILFFVIGMLIAMHIDLLRSFLKTVPEVVTFSILVAAITTIMYFATSSLTSELFIGTANTVLISFVVTSSSLDRFSSSAIPSWLGRISYSLYLVHLIVLIGMIYLLAATLPLAVILIFAIFASLGVAHIIYRYVEAPSRSLGYRIAGCQLARVGPTALIYARKSFPSIIGDF